ELTVSQVSSLPTAESASLPSVSSSDTIRIKYSESAVEVTGEVEGVSVDATTQAVSLTSTAATPVVYALSGSTTTGSFTIASAADASTVVLNGLTMTNSSGSAINNQSARL
ncbi:MAG: carbohydrate-binding domain-containing protein, partial [Paludibacteraceae bacterium]|nr:carbohydrate-binding domain-containing protein [Paludibacteraceae bacterium]